MAVRKINRFQGAEGPRGQGINKKELSEEAGK
jgi:hypothetical protein